MHYQKNHLLVAVTMSVLFFLCFSTSFADVVYKQKSTTSGFMGLGTIDIEIITVLKGDKQKQETGTKFTGTMAQFMPEIEKQEQITITRLDKKLVWNIDMSEKTYTEITFKQMKKTRGKVITEKEKTDEEEIETKLQFEVKKSGKKKKIGGYECEEFIIKMITEGKNPQTSETQELEIYTHLWVSDQVKGYDQIQKFRKKMAEKMGWDEGYGTGLMQSVKQYGIETKELGEKMKEIKGFPMLTVVKMKAFGEEITEADEGEESEQLESIEAAMKMLGKKMGEAHQPGEKGVLFTMTTEVTDIQIKEVADSEFELPKGLKKQKN